MSDFKTCPRCGSKVPQPSSRCRMCEHQFKAGNHVEPGSGAPVSPKAALTVIVVVGAMIAAVVLFLSTR
jgi:uncharacterized membrane protein YvbJ